MDGTDFLKYTFYYFLSFYLKDFYARLLDNACGLICFESSGRHQLKSMENLHIGDMEFYFSVFVLKTVFNRKQALGADGYQGEQQISS